MDTQTQITVHGMTCHSCVRHVRGALLGLDGVEAVEVTLADGLARVRHDPDAAPVPALIAAITEIGYSAASAPPGR